MPYEEQEWRYGGWDGAIHGTEAGWIPSSSGHERGIGTMSIERRGLIAIVLSMGLWFAYDAIYLSPKMERGRAEQARIAREMAIADSIAAANRIATTPDPAENSPQTEAAIEPYVAPSDTAGLAEAKLPTAADVEAVEFTVVSDLYEISLTSRGGEITSTRLLDYTTNGEAVELFPQNPGWTGRRVLNLSLDGANSSIPITEVGFQAFVGASSTQVLAGTRITVDPNNEFTLVTFRAATAGGGAIERTYRFFPDRHYIDAGVQYNEASFPGTQSITWGLGPGMASTEENVEDDQQNFKASVLLGEEFKRRKPSNYGETTKDNYSGTFNWASLQTKYFTTAIIPEEPTRADVEISGSKEGHRITAKVTLPASPDRGRVDQSIRVYMGPLEADSIKELNVGLERSIEMGWSLIRPVSWGILWAMKAMYKVIPNYGWVIILISVLTKVLFYRLTHKSFKSMKEMQDLSPKLQAIKEKYKDDRQKVSEETMKAYREAGVNPLGGCLPLVLQMPVFIALFNVLKFTIEVRGASWFGWITDLSQQDILFALPFSIPFIGAGFSVLPILMGAAMLIQSKLGGSPTGGPTAQTPPGFQTMLPIVFTVLFYKMPSGLVLYWLVNTVLSAVQQYYIHRGADSDTTDDAKDEPNKGKHTKRRLKTKER